MQPLVKLRLMDSQFAEIAAPGGRSLTVLYPIVVSIVGSPVQSAGMALVTK
jgi:hypothetical protein